MDWLHILKFILDAKGFDDKASKARVPLEAAKKISKKKTSDLTWDDIQHFDNKITSAAITGVRQLLAASEKAEKVKLELPESDHQKKYITLVTAAGKNGPQSPQCNKARLGYLASLRVYDSKLKLQLKNAAEIGAKLERNLKPAKAMVSYGDLLSKIFQSWAKLPTLGSSARQAQMLGLSQDARNYSGLAGSLCTSMQRLHKKNAAFAKLCSETIKNNQMWITWVLKNAAIEEKVLKKNLKSKEPSK